MFEKQLIYVGHPDTHTHTLCGGKNLPEKKTQKGFQPQKKVLALDHLGHCHRGAATLVTRELGPKARMGGRETKRDGDGVVKVARKKSIGENIHSHLS